MRRQWLEMPAPHRVLVVDDEPNILDVLSMALRFQGFEVETAATGGQALAAAAAFKPQLMVLDIMLPDMEGFEVARRLGARRAEIPIIFLTARDATEDKVRGLTLGGDDYVTKPFSLEELIARIRNVLRRTGQAAPESSRLAFEDIELDDDTREVARAGAPIDLTATEYRLLRYLMLNPRRVLDARADPQPGVGLRLRRRRARAGDLRQLPAQEARRPRPAADPHGAWRRLRAAGAARAMSSLRARLIAVMLVVAAAGLLTLAGITYAEQRSFLLDRADVQLRTAVPAMEHQLLGDRGRRGEPRGGGPPPGDVNLPPGTYGELRDASGAVIAGPEVITYGQEPPDPPELPAELPYDHAVTVPSGGELDYRVQAVADRTGMRTLVVAVPLAEADETLDRLLLVEGLVIAGVLLLLGVVAALLVRLGLRPLDRMGTTAGIIAGGDLSQRVTPATPRTEVGRLGLALNAMLERLEEAFARRQESEDRLRRFLSDASHELRTPLASIRGYAELFRMGAAREQHDVEKAMRRIEEEAARMGVLVDDLLALARLDELRDPVRQIRRRRRGGARRRRRRARGGARALVRAECGRGRSRARRPPPGRPGARQPAAQRDRAHAARHIRRGHGGARRRGRARTGARPRSRSARRRRGRGVRPLLARRAGSRARQGRCRPRAGDRRRDRRGARRQRACRQRAGRRRVLHRAAPRGGPRAAG